MSRHTTTRMLAAALGTATAAAVLIGVPASDAAGRANNVVTIKAEGTDLSGTVKSNRRACKNERKVLLILQRGARGGANDELFASDTTELRNGVGHWNTGNLGFEGKFYAKIKRTAQCKAATSRTVRAIREE
ncbi:MAG TPA: hypothetical protein VNQ53_13570 [Nocardioides sp.]|nr:hypothetical protein [Nocardioides sp.]